MKIFSQLLLIQVVLVILLTTRAFALPLQGIWNSKCESEGLLHKYVSIEIYDDIWKKTTWWASDDRCENISLEQQTMFSFSMSNEIWSGKALMAYIRPYTKTLAEQFNRESLCGHNNWKHGRVIEVTGLSCQNFLIPGYEQISNAALKIEGPRNNMLWLDGILYLLDPSSF